MGKSKKAVKRRKFLQNVACFSVVACSSSAIVAGVTCSILFSRLEPVERQYFSLVLDAGSGQFENGNHAIAFDVQLKTTWGEIKEKQIAPSPFYVGHGFTGWVMNGQAIPDDHIFLEDTVVNATYSVNRISVSFTNQSELKVKEGDVALPAPLTNIRYGMNWSDVKKSSGKQLFPSIRGGLNLYFTDYYVDHDHNPKTDKIRIADSYVFDGDTELEAHYDATIKFQNSTSDDKVYGAFDYVDATFPIGTKWGDVNTPTPDGKRKKYEPRPTDAGEEEAMIFDRYSEGGQTSEAIEENYQINHPATFHAIYEAADAKSFETDVWAAFLKHIEGKAFEDLSDENDPYYSEYHNKIDRATHPEIYKIEDTFVGLRRKLKVNGYEFTIRVVEENKDWSVENDWHFLFEFENVLYAPTPYNAIDIETQYQNLYYNQTKGEPSTLDYYLNGTFLDWFPTKIKEYWNNEQHQNRYYSVEYCNVENYSPLSSTSNEDGIETINRHIFAPSTIELGIEKFPEPVFDVPKEGDTFAFYKNIKAKESEEVLQTFRKKTFVDNPGSTHAYWLRTPDIFTTNYSWGINQEGTIGYEYEEGKYEPYASVEDVLYVSPIIAI